MTYALRGARSPAGHPLAAPIARIIALTAPGALGLSGDPFHEPFHARGPASRRPVHCAQCQRGTQRTARFCVLATGCLSACQVPPLPGLGSFAGPWYHTSRWPRAEVDFTGMRVGLIGTGGQT